jgi:gamma-glutamylcyclotransferase (GGCT)/AIG2-like uncharacterized protein YtfP
MRLFLYGTLLDADTLATRGGHACLPARLVPAALRGRRRVAVRGGRYPTLRRERTGVVHGGSLIASAHALRKLAAYEGPAYRLTRVVVDTPNGKTAAHTWIALGGTRVPWKAEGRYLVGASYQSCKARSVSGSPFTCQASTPPRYQ